MSTQRILLIAPRGQVGWELMRCTQLLGEVITAGRNEQFHLDLAQPETIRNVVREIQPTLILNAAAYTAVDKAEQETQLAHAINGLAPGILAEEAHRLHSTLVHYSTDYVFDGSLTRPYVEQDKVCPLNTYGASKLAGEQAIEAVGGRYFIFRTAWVYGLRGKNFLLTIQRLAKEREELSIVADQIGAPTWSRMIAQATVQILSQLAYRPSMETPSGIYHLTCSGQTSWYEFAKAILTERSPRLLPVTTDQYPSPTRRPVYSVLSNAKLMTTFGISLPAWEKGLQLCLDSQ